MLRKIVLLIPLVCLLFWKGFSQGVTTSSISGQILDEQNKPLEGATVIALHVPSGSEYGINTRNDGRYNLNNLRPGGPYIIQITFLGFQGDKKDQVYLTLGQNYSYNVQLKAESIQLVGAEVVFKKDPLLNSTNTGAGTNIDEEAINALPTVGRDLSDFTRLTPQATVTPNGGISIAGINNRYNSIFIDGAVNNDVFGLAETGTNGGQTNITPISLDAIEELQVNVAPYDVTQGNFAGGSINAITRSGTNDLKGSAYWLFRNQELAGKTPTDNESVRRTKLANFTSNIGGFRLGGPILKNKLFFFINGEVQRQKTPQPFNFSDYNGTLTQADFEQLSNTLKTKYNYDPGSYLDNPSEVNSNKLLAKIDWNINRNHKISIRHSYTFGEYLNTSRSSAILINFYNNGIYFPSTTNSTAIDLKSTLGKNVNNQLILGYTRVSDDRDAMGKDFPRVIIEDQAAKVNLGTESFSNANQLKQDIVTLTNNLNWYKNRHTFTFGTHNEFYSTYNLFIRQNFGEYTFSSLNSFMNGETAKFYNRSYSLIDNKTGDGSKAAVDYDAIQFGLYAQDAFQATDKLRVTLGVRLDIPFFLNEARGNEGFNDTTISKLENAGWDLKGAKVGQLQKTQLLFSPRLGLNYDLKGDKSLILRGGIGIFTSRIPYVWPSAAYLYNGYVIGSTSKAVAFNPDPYNQPTDPGFKVPTGEINLIAKNFKYPQVLKISAAIDKQLPGGIVATFEGIYSKYLNNINYKNVNIEPLSSSTRSFTGADNRPYFNRSNRIESAYTYILLLENTNKGYGYNLTAQLQKPFENGFTASLAYTFGESKVINDGSASQNSSQWRFIENVNGKNNLDLSYSDFDMGRRIVGFASYRKEYAGFMATTLSLFYNGQSGKRFSYIYKNQMSNDDTGSGSTEADLIYVPTNSEVDEMVFEPILDNNKNVIRTAEEQKADFKAYLEENKYLNKERGNYSERNGDRLPFVNTVDLRILQDFYITTGKTKHTLQFSFDIFNFTNFISSKWGRSYFLTNDNYPLITYTGVVSGTTTPKYQFNKPKSDIYGIDDSGINSARWQAQFGVRYTF